MQINLLPGTEQWLKIQKQKDAIVQKALFDYRKKEIQEKTMLEKTKRIVFFGMILLIIMLVMFLFLKPIPIVKYSVSTGRCVEIEIEGKCYSCEKLNELKKYETMFVK